VIGIPDAYHGEVVKACIVPRDANVSVEDLRTHCKQHLAAYKVPTEFELRESLPQSAVGKILYRVLRDEVSSAAGSPRPQEGAEKRG
jgi:long-chain acyl-CoA synthetase